MVERLLRYVTYIFGSDSHLTLNVRAGLARMLREQGALGESADVLTWLVEALGRRYGDDDARTVYQRSWLAYTFRRLGRAAEAVVLQEEVVRARRLPGGDGALLLKSEIDLVRDLTEVGRHEEARVPETLRRGPSRDRLGRYDACAHASQARRK
jgi:hypothetical protein